MNIRSPLLALLLSLCAVSPGFADLVLADKSTALPVTLHPEAGDALRFAAEDLARILGVMTGTTPEIHESVEPRGIVIGTTEQFGMFGDDPALVIRDVFDGREAYVIRPDHENRRLWILGNREDGASHGVYSLLRGHGYRALFPGANWEVIPQHPMVRVDGPSEGRPKVVTRMIWAGFGSFDKEQTRDVEIWRQRNRLGESISGSIGHSWESMIRHNQEAFESNPALYGEHADGSLNKHSLRHGTQAVVDFTVDWFRRRLENPRTQDILSLAPTDGDNYTRDAGTAARGEINESFYWFVNEVAKRMREIAPDKLVGTTAYYLHAKPPSFDLEPNVIVLGATMFGSGGLTLEDFFAVWSKSSRYFGVRDYIYSGYQTHADHPDGGYPSAYLERQHRWLRDYPIVYYSAEGLWEWGLRGPGYYTLAQLLWDPEQEPREVADDFRAAAFGPGAGAMARYHEALEPTGKAVRKHQLGRAVAALREAAAAARSDPGAAARVNDMKLYFIHVALLEKMRGLERDDPQRLALAAESLEWNFRNRRSYLLNYNCNRRLWMVNRVLLGDFFERDRNTFTIRGEDKPTSPEEQDAVIARTLGEGWRMEGGYIVPADGAAESLTPATAEEIGAKFERIVVPQFPAVEVEEIAYSADFVPVDTGLQLRAAENETLWFGANATFLVWRADPAEIAFRVTPNVRYRERVGDPAHSGMLDARPLEITVRSPDGSVSEPLLLQQDNEPRDIRVGIDKPGLSEIHFHTKRMGMMLEVGQPEFLALPIDENRVVFINPPPRASEKISGPLYFYVPKGIREIQAFSNAPQFLLKNTKIGPVDGGEAMIDLDGELLRIQVVPGGDGKVWQITEGGVGVRFYFFNLPNILSLHPGKMLLPREVAEKDGLHRITP